jgi:hypothetical protein
MDSHRGDGFRVRDRKHDCLSSDCFLLTLQKHWMRKTQGERRDHFYVLMRSPAISNASTLQSCLFQFIVENAFNFID